jgi:hypothetical protein
VADPSPFEVLGLLPSATVAEIRAARRVLAQQHHPDHGGDPQAMVALNQAFEAAVAHATGRRPLDAPAPTDAAGEGPPARRPSTRPVRGVQHDSPSFTIDALPAEAFEALLVAASWIGEVLIDDPPYLLEAHLLEPATCWCRLDLLPEAGGSIVNLTVASVSDGPAVDLEAVRDVWVDRLNQLGRDGWPA